MKKYIIMTTNDLEIMLNIAANRSIDHFRVIGTDDNTDGEGIWHCDVEFYTANRTEPVELYSFDSAQREGEIKEATVAVKYLLDKPTADYNMHGLGYWATRLEELRKKED